MATKDTKWDKSVSMRDDVVKETAADLKRTARGLKPDAPNEPARDAQRSAGERANTRNMTRAGAAGMALSAGYGVGRSIGEAGGDELVRKGIEKSGLGKAIDKASVSDRVELSESAKERIAKGETKGKGDDERVNKEDYPTYKKDTKSAEVFRESFRDAKDAGKDTFKYEGRTYSTEEKLAKGGMVMNKGIGASMKPHNVFNSKGKK